MIERSKRWLETRAVQFRLANLMKNCNLKRNFGGGLTPKGFNLHEFRPRSLVEHTVELGIWEPSHHLLKYREE
jgi:hypothetical protein